MSIGLPVVLMSGSARSAVLTGLRRAGGAVAVDQQQRCRQRLSRETRESRLPLNRLCSTCCVLIVGPRTHHRGADVPTYLYTITR